MISAKALRKITQNFNVLYVEDEKDIREKMLLYLNKFFAFVVSATNGEEGLVAYKKQKFDVVITDLSMPKMDGIEMIEAIQMIKEDQSILITTAHTEAHYMLRAIKDGVDGYILKPFEFEQLNNELYKITNKLHALKENENYKFHLQQMVTLKTNELQKLVDYQNDNYEKTLYSMIDMIESRDTYTAGHSRRVAQYSEMIAKELGCSEEECLLIYQAAILHDVEKIATPDAVLLNPKKLNTLEYKLIQEHVTVSYQLLKSIPMFAKLAEIVYMHHERYDGTGYPRRLRGTEISLLGHILIVSDAFDAMTTNRIYKGRKSIPKALEEIRSLSEIQFHPQVVKKALNALKDVVIDSGVSQLPNSKLEEERFAYFYKDILSGAYNQNYLDVVLLKNTHHLSFKFMDIISIKNFSSYNKEYGWKEGDVLLKLLAKSLVDLFENSFVFRIFGDDFVVMSKTEENLTQLKELLSKELNSKNLSYKINTINLEEEHIYKVSQIEKIQLDVR